MACAGGGKGDKGSRQREERGSGEASSSVVELNVVRSAAWLSPSRYNRQTCPPSKLARIWGGVR